MAILGYKECPIISSCWYWLRNTRCIAINYLPIMLWEKTPINWLNVCSSLPYPIKIKQDIGSNVAICASSNCITKFTILLGVAITLCLYNQLDWWEFEIYNVPFKPCLPLLIIQTRSFTITQIYDINEEKSPKTNVSRACV